LDVVILEGWMLGFAAQNASQVDSAMLAPNSFLDQYNAWTQFVDSWIILSATELEHIVEWRVDAERTRRLTGPALPDSEARDYIERFLPAYRLYCPQLAELYRDGLHIKLNADRSAID
jgi:pantothenate kinase-related protein Tda10